MDVLRSKSKSSSITFTLWMLVISFSLLLMSQFLSDTGQVQSLREGDTPTPSATPAILLESCDIHRLTNDLLEDYFFKTDGTNVYWLKNEGSQSGLFRFDGIQTVRLSDAMLTGTYDGGLDVEGSKVVWIAPRVSNPAASDIYLYENGVISKITDTNTLKYYPSTDGTLVAWIEGQATNQVSIYQGGNVTQIPAPQAFWLDTSGGSVVWAAVDGSDNEIYWYKNGVTTKIEHDGYNDLYPRTDGQRVVWYASNPSEVNDSDTEIFVSDGITTERITNNDVDDVSPKIEANLIVWSGLGASQGDISLYDGLNITLLTLSGNFPSLDGNRIIWLNSGSPDNGLLLYKYPSGAITRVGMTTNIFNTDIQSSTVAWIEDPYNGAFESSGWEIGVAYCGGLPPTPTSTATMTPTAPATLTHTPLPTDTSAPTYTPTATATDTPVSFVSYTPSSTATPSSEPSETSTATTVFTPTSTNTPENLVENSGFEAVSGDDTPVLLPWTISNGTGDKIKCDTLTKIVAHTGKCAFMFKGSVGENSKLQQILDLTGMNFEVGDRFDLDIYVNTSNFTISGKIKLIVQYSDGTDSTKLSLPLTQTIGGYQVVSGNLTIMSSSVSKIKIQIVHKSPSGKIYLDDFNLLLGTPTVNKRIPMP